VVDAGRRGGAEVHAIVHGVARILGLGHQRMATQLERAGVSLEQAKQGSDAG
jgi:hypothetical protein